MRVFAASSPKNLKMENIKGIIFDYGGTIDSRGTHWSEILWDGYCHVGLDAKVTKEQFREAYVYAERYLATNVVILPEDNFHTLLLKKVEIEMRDLVAKGLITEAEAAASVDGVADYCYNQAKLCVTEASEVLDVLSRKYPMVLVSNFYGNIEAVLSDFGIRKYFPTIIESAVVGVRKPDPAIFGMGVEALGFKPEEVLVVGDSYKKDILPSLSLGCKVAWLKGKGWTADEDAVVHPSIISSLRDLL